MTGSEGGIGYEAERKCDPFVDGREGGLEAFLDLGFLSVDLFRPPRRGVVCQSP